MNIKLKITAVYKYENNNITKKIENLSVRYDQCGGEWERGGIGGLTDGADFWVGDGDGEGPVEGDFIP